ncbi:MAG: prepilin-type N-terminal cleavage/methylation domain-containing protein [Planctomycetales bacterium]|nr:prepilin-type N-terminal cleavage/methylation domain-containing protein [Planctomycetales bacterium]
MSSPLRTKLGLGSRRGMTLAELLVVLVILAVVTTVAVQSLGPVAEQGRYEATARTLAHIRAAIATENEGVTSGFVADNGCFPESLSELLAQPDRLPAFSVYNYTDEHGNSFPIPRGWRGPYLQLPIGTSDLTDGWGAPLLFDRVTEADRLLITSPAATRPGSSIQQDLQVAIPVMELRAALLRVQLYRVDGHEHLPPAGTGTWTVTLVSPAPIDDGMPNGVALIPLLEVPSGTAGIDLPTFQIVSEGTDDQRLAMGPRVLQATLNGQAMGQPTFFHIRPGATHLIDVRVE